MTNKLALREKNNEIVANGPEDGFVGDILCA